MKITHFLALLLLPFFVSAQSGNSMELNKNAKSKFPIESAKVSYIISGEATGTATMYFDRNGWRQILIKEITFEKFGISSTEKTVELIDGDFYFKANLNSKKGAKYTDSNWSSLLSYKAPEEILEITMESKGGVFSGDTTLLNYSVGIWNFSKGATRSIWTLEGITLREVKMIGKIRYEMIATEVNDTIKIEDDDFTLPEGIAWSEPD
ncbi:MAG: hypothetical protein JXR03_17605 [Cyclobacteriaceae bacterium]